MEAMREFELTLVWASYSWKSVRVAVSPIVTVYVNSFVSPPTVSCLAFVLPAGFFWGWLFSRQGSILGTSISHAMIGIYAFFIVGFDFIIG